MPSLYEQLKSKLRDVVPDVELRLGAELATEINRLKREKNAVVLAHNYMEPVLFHAIADFGGDSLELSRRAASTDAEMIVFCGVRFMAETAKVLSPDKTVLLPSEEAGCSLAESITADDVRELRRRLPGSPVVAYVNTYADVKAEVDVCCTSANAAAVVRSLDRGNDRPVALIPDEFLAQNVARETGRTITGWPGRCEVHEKFSVDDVNAARRQFPDVVVLAHPECRPEVVELCDFTGSTGSMIRYVEQSRAERFLLLTECSMGDNVAAANPDKQMLRLCSVRCPHMASITLENTLEALRREQHVIEVPEEIRVRAERSLRRMLEL